MSGITGLNHITLCVTNLAHSIDFYCETLGAVLRAKGARAAYLELGPVWLCLELADSVAPRMDDSHIAFGCSAADFDALSERIRAVAHLWKENRSEGASLYFRDPDGHKLELHVGVLQDRLAHYAARTDAPMRIVAAT